MLTQGPQGVHSGDPLAFSALVPSESEQMCATSLPATSNVDVARLPASRLKQCINKRVIKRTMGGIQCIWYKPGVTPTKTARRPVKWHKTLIAGGRLMHPNRRAAMLTTEGAAKGAQSATPLPSRSSGLVRCDTVVGRKRARANEGKSKETINFSTEQCTEELPTPVRRIRERPRKLSSMPEELKVPRGTADLFANVLHSSDMDVCLSPRATYESLREVMADAQFDGAIDVFACEYIPDELFDQSDRSDLLVSPDMPVTMDDLLQPSEYECGFAA